MKIFCEKGIKVTGEIDKSMEKGYNKMHPEEQETSE